MIPRFRSIAGLPSLALALCSAACAPVASPVEADSASEAADTAEDAETPWVDGEVEQVPGVDPAPPGSCTLVLECGVDIPDEPKVDCDFTVLNDAGDLQYEGPAGVELRGRSSGSAPKHQYAVELRDEAGDDLSVNLLGMGGEADWVLNGLYYDRSLMRNALAFEVFNAMDPARYAPEARYCTLELDGQPQGLYLLTERVEADDDRIVLPEDDGTGSVFVLKLDDENALYPNFLGNGYWRVVSPTEPTPEQNAGIVATLQAWGNAAREDPASLEEHLDVDAWIDLILLQEFMKNNDAFYLSLFLWRDASGRMSITPWDLDLTLGQPSYNDNENPESWILYRPELVSTLEGLPDFDARLEARWQELRAGVLERDAVHARLDAFQAIMGDHLDENWEIWDIQEVDFYGYLYPVSSYEEEDARVRAFVDARLEWMDNNIGRWSEGP